MLECKPCHEFTPLLEELYQDMNADSKVFEVVFFSGDAKEEQFKTYFSKMVWPALPWKDARIKALATEIKIKGVPHLLAIKRDGTILQNSAVKAVTEGGPEYVQELLD